MEKLYVNAKATEIEKIIVFAREKLEKYKVSDRETQLFESIVEGVFMELCYNQIGDNNKIEINISNFFGDVKINMLCKGTPCDIAEAASGIKLDDMELGLSGEVVTREIIRNSFKDIISASCIAGVNHVKINVKKTQYRNLRNTIFALAFGIIAGLLVKFLVPDVLKSIVVNDGTKVISTLFLNAIKMLVAPLVFFSIAAGVSGMGNVNTLGKIGSRVILMYFFTSFVAIAVGIGIYYIFGIGSPELANAVNASAAASSSASAVSVTPGLGSTLKDTLLSMIPDNFFNAFVSMNMIGIIFIAVLLGISVTIMQKNSAQVINFIDSGNELFGKMTSIVMKFLPLSVFCSMITMVVSLDSKSLLSMLQLLGVIYLAEFIMVSFYGIMLGLVGSVNPLIFYKKFLPVMITALAFSSSTPTIPASLECCDKKLGIDKKVYSFSIPLGATINMDGSCIVMAIVSLFFSKVFGLQVTPIFLITLVFTIFILSVGAPGVPGATLICISIVFSTIGIPSDATNLIMGIYPLIGMILACNNVTGDAAATTLVARKNSLINLETFNS